MIALVVAAIFGALTGLFFKNRFASVLFPVVVSGALHGVIIFIVTTYGDRFQLAVSAADMRGWFGTSQLSILPTIAAAAVAAALANLMRGEEGTPGGRSISRLGQDPDSPGIKLPVKNGKRAFRRSDLVEERAIHEVAQSRIDKILGL
jgi:hypothetical protein